MGVSGMRFGVAAWNAMAVAGVVLVTALACDGASAQGAACGKPEFEAVVESAASTLRDLNARNKPSFQDKLRLLKDKRGWSSEQFMTEAAVYVQDDSIGALDTRSGDLLNRVNTMGEAGASAKTPDCKLLADLRSTMQALVDTQTEKWTYMFAKLNKALAP